MAFEVRFVLHVFEGRLLNAESQRPFVAARRIRNRGVSHIH